MKRSVVAGSPVGWHRRWRRNLRRPRWSLTLLLFSCGLAGVAMFNALRSLRSQERVADSVLQDYARFAAWSYGGHLRDMLEIAVKEAIGGVNHGSSVHTNRTFPGPDWLPLSLLFDPRCGCRVARWGPVPVAFFGFSVRGDTIGMVKNAYPTPALGWRADPRDTLDSYQKPRTRRPSSVADRWVLDTLRRQIHSSYRSEWGFTYVAGHDHLGVTRYLAYTLMPTAWGDTLVYGVEYSRDGFARLVSQILDRGDLLPTAITSRYRNQQLLVLEVDDASAGPLFTSEPTHVWRRDAGTRLPASYGGFEVRAEIRPEFAGQLVIGGLPRSRLPFLITLLLVAAGLSAVAIGQLRREDELNRLRADFVATVSHELRTPLAQIRLDLDTLRLRRFPTEEHRAAALSRVDRETRRLAYLTENILRFSRRERVAVANASDTLDPASEVARTVEEFRPLAAARRVALQLDLETCRPIRCNTDALRQVLLNLLDNAVKYGPPRQTIVVTVRRAGSAVRITVIDEGPGVSPDERSTIWEPFRRGVDALRQGVGGSGIGLTIVRETVTAYGGRAGVDPAARGGAAFFVEFPTVSATDGSRADITSTPVLAGTAG